MTKNNIEKLFQINLNAYQRDKNNALRMKFILFEELKLTINFKVIGITGTNGKGSLTQYLYEGLKEKYPKIGIFTSPHLSDWTERIVFNNKKILKKTFWNYYKKISFIVQKYHLIFFEIFFLISILYFLDKKIDLLILEYGIGAKNDCCNCLLNDYSVITNIQNDHKNYFSGSLLKTLKNKKFIFQEKSINIAFFTSDILNLLPKIKKMPLFLNTKDYLDNITFKKKYYFFTYKEKKYQIKSFSLCQVYNCSLAIEIFLQEKISYEKIFKKLKNLKLKDKFKINLEKKMIFDPCHNLAGVEAFFISYQNFQNYIGFKENFYIYFACQKSKDWKEIIIFLKKSFNLKNLIFVDIKNKNFISLKHYLLLKINKDNIIDNKLQLFKLINKKMSYHFFIGSFYFLQYIKKLEKEGNLLLTEVI